MNEHDPEELKRIAWLQLVALREIGSYLADCLEEVAFAAGGSPVFDPGGELLFYRVGLLGNSGLVGLADIAAHEDLGAQLLAVTRGLPWDDAAVKGEATDAAIKKQFQVEGKRLKLVAFNYPKVGVQFLEGDEEIVMLQWPTWEVVANTEEGDSETFTRWSLLRNVPDVVARRNRAKHRELFGQFIGLLSDAVDIRELMSDPARYTKLLESLVSTDFKVRQLMYRGKGKSHACFGLRSQKNARWCVPACVQMVLDFYRYEYSQGKLARKLGQGKLATASTLPCMKNFTVVKILEKMSCQSLEAYINSCPSSFWRVATREIDRNRPSILFSAGHSRVIVGYATVLVTPKRIPLRGFLLYDPLPICTGQVTCWESVDSLPYTTLFTARLRRA